MTRGAETGVRPLQYISDTTEKKYSGQIRKGILRQKHLGSRERCSKRRGRNEIRRSSRKIDGKD